MNKPIVGITMGDPAGSGPEITIKALADPEQYSYCRPIVVGDVKVMEQAKKFVGREDIVIHRCEKVSDALFTPGTIDVLHLDLIEDISKFEIAKVSVEGGNAAFQCVKKVIELAMAGEVDATCTNALNKEAMNKALEYYHGEKSDGYTHFDGHTEIYATYTHTKKYTMMLAHHDLRVVHVSTHVSLREACDRVKKDRVLEVIEIANKACKDMGIENPRIAVAGLNPHCGENGLFGREEIEEITPAIEAAKAEGITGVVGPCPPDSVFSQAIGGWYDIVVCMYHDQGHIPLKTVGFVYDREKQEWKAVEGVNVTLGLPIIRASVDHGTDFYHAGKEIEEITPAIEAAKAEGITGVVGPCPPDSVFSQAIGGWYDIVVCMYHDQGHIPLKTVGFVYDREKQEWKAVEGVNVTLGLPIIRASVDHGTDFYHAGKGNGNELSLVNAIKYAVKMTGRAN